MSQSWQRLTMRFEALGQREKRVVGIAGLLALALVGYSLWLEPVMLSKAAVEKDAAQQRGELASLQAQTDMLRARANDPDAANRAALADVQKQLAQREEALRKFDGSLVPPERMPQLLEALLARFRGLELISLKTLPVQPLVQKDGDIKAAVGSAPSATPNPPPSPTAAPAASAALATETAAAGKAAGVQVYRHGIELRLAGNFNELHAYVQELERAKQRPILVSMEYSVSKYPRAELTLTLYSLSMDERWLLM